MTPKAPTRLGAEPGRQPPGRLRRATGEARFVREFVEVAFLVAGVRKEKNTTEYL